MCNELLLKLQYKSYEKETEYTGVHSVFMPASTKFKISPPLVKRFSKFRMLRAGKLMLSPFLEHWWTKHLRQSRSPFRLAALQKNNTFFVY